MRNRLALVLVMSAALVLACENSSTPGPNGTAPKVRGGVDGTPAGKGVRIATGITQDVRITLDGKWVVYLQEVKKPAVEGLPPSAVVGDLYASPVAGGPPHRLGSGVTNLPGGYLFTPDSRWVLFRTSFDMTTQAGQLQAVRFGEFGSPAILGDSVTALAVSASSHTVGWVEGGVLRRAELGSNDRTEIAGGVAVAEFSPDGQRLFYRRKLSSGGGLFAVTMKAGDAPVKLAEQVGDFRLSLDSKAVAFTRRSEAEQDTYDLFVALAPRFEPQRVARGAGIFAFSADSRFLARVEGVRPDALGELVVGPASGGAGRKVGERVQDFSFAPDSTGLAFDEKYDVRSRTGHLGYVALPDGKPVPLATRAQNYEWGSDGKFIAYLGQFNRPDLGIYSTDLMVFPTFATDATSAVKAGEGVFGYGFAPKNPYLLLRTKCTREGRACDLRRLDLSQLSKPPEQVAEGVYNFRPSPTDGSRILISYARLDSEAYDLAVYDVKGRTLEVIDRAVILPGFWVGSEQKDIVYAVVDRTRAGIYRASALAPAPAAGK